MRRCLAAPMGQQEAKAQCQRGPGDAHGGTALRDHAAVRAQLDDSPQAVNKYLAHEVALARELKQVATGRVALDRNLRCCPGHPHSRAPGRLR